MLDMRTIVFSNVLTDIVCLVVIVLLWQQTRRRFTGIGFFVLDFALQTTALFLIILRGQIPVWMSFVLANTFVMAGALLGYMGLSRFVGKKSFQIHNYILLTAFVFAHTYFTFVQPNLPARNLNLSLVLLIICLQCSWLLLYRVKPDMRPLTRGLGIVFGVYCLLSIIRIIEFFGGEHIVGDYFQSGMFEKFILVAYQILFIVLTYSLILMVNKRLLVDIKTGEEKFSKAFYSSPYAITITRLSDGQIIEVNESFHNITGYQLADIQGKTTLAMHLWERDENRALVVSELAEKGKVRQREFQFRKKSGEIMIGLFSAEIITINNEKCILSSINDITERKLMEETLRESDQQFHLIADNIRDTVWLMDLDMRTTWISPSVVKTRGYTLAELAEMPMDRNLTPESLAYMMELAATELTPERLADPDTDISVNVDLEYYRKDGSTFWGDTSVALLRDNEGRPFGFLGVGRDISERKLAEMALRKLDSQYQNLFENSLEGIAQSTPEGKLINVNIAFAKMFGYESSEEIGKAVDDVTGQLYANPQEREKVTNAIREKGYIKDFECKMRRKDGSTFWALINTRLNEDKEGTNYFESFIIDITRRKKAEEEIIRLNAELKKLIEEQSGKLHKSQLALLSIVEDLNISTKQIEHTNKSLELTNKELESFSYSVSHDLRAPLRSIDGFSQALLEDYSKKLDDTGRTYLKKIRAATQNMSLLIDDILKLSRVTRFVLHHEPVDLSKMFREIVKNYQKNDPARIVDIVIQKGIIIHGDNELIRIALTNMIDNAWKFTGRKTRSKIEFGTTYQEDKKVVFIRDNGVGFDMAYVDKLFGTFQRLHTTADFPGTGIGLATIQRIIRRHGGEIWAEGEVGKGAGFYFTLPE